MRDDYSKIPEKGAVENVATRAATATRGKNRSVAVLPEEIGGNAQIDVGDAKKVFEKFFRKRAVAALQAGTTEPVAGTGHPVIYSLSKK
jgi:hypothetical protein